MRQDTTIAINAKRRKALTDAALDVTGLTRQHTRMCDVVHFMIDNYLEKAQLDMIAYARKHKDQF